MIPATWGEKDRVQDISIAKAYSAPLVLTLLALALAATLGQASGVRPVGLFWPYWESWASVTFVCLMLWALVEVARMAIARVDKPLPALASGLWGRAPLAGIPGVLFPFFLAGYTWSKCSIPFLVGYGWEGFWADADRAVLGRDAWQVAHAIMPAAAAPFWSFFYSVIWGFALVFSGALTFAFRSRRETATFFTALMLSWLIGGIGVAYAVSAGGPTFVHLTDPALASRFAPMRAELIAMLGQDDVVMKSQRYLAAAIHLPYAVKGGGVSAMPSMHIATATILLASGWRRWWRPIAMLFWLMTFFGSVYFGYHYAWDAPVAAVIAIMCWVVAKRFLREEQPAADILFTQSPQPAG